MKMYLCMASFRGAEPAMRELFEFPFSEKRRSGTCHNSPACIAKKRQCFSHSLSRKREKREALLRKLRARPMQREATRATRTSNWLHTPAASIFISRATHRAHPLFRADICARMGLGSFCHFLELVNSRK
jgi:hypothetical protein